MGQFGLAGKVLGEGMRISLLGSTVPVSSGLSAGAIDGGLHTFSAVVVTVLGISATLMLGPVSVRWRVYAALLIALLVSAVILAALAVRNRWPLVGNATRAIGRLPRLHTWVSLKQPIIDSAEDNLLSFRDEAPAAFWATLIFNLLWHMDAIDRQRTTVGSHERIGIFRVFGRDAGYTALYTAYVTAVRCCIPEYKVDLNHLMEILIQDKRNNPSNYSLVILSEGAEWQGYKVREYGEADPFGHRKKMSVAED